MRSIVRAVVIAIALAMFLPMAANAQSISIPSIGVNAPVVPGNLGGSIHKVYGEVPNFGSGVLIGHSYIRGGVGQGAVFDRLPSIRKGAVVVVGKKRLVVTKTIKVSVSRYRQMLPRLNSLRGHARVVLVTCTDRNDATGIYAKRFLAFTKPVA